MPASRPGLSRLFPAAALVAALGLPLTACAQAQAAEAPAGEAEVVIDAETVSVDLTEAKTEAKTEAETDAEATETQEAPEKTAEELAREKDEQEIKRLQHEAKLRSARLSAELAPLQEKKQRLEAEISLLTAKQSAEQAKLKLKKDQADFEQQMELAELARDMQAMQQQLQAMTVKGQLEKLEQQQQVADLTAENARLAAEAMLLQSELALVQARRSAASIDTDEMAYPKKPLNGKTLTISDRRIPLNGPIGGGTADYVTERIHYYNNLDDDAPIFIVIDSSPGGSVMEGFRIVTAMQNSDAPVHVVVKSFAASMAAVITTLADESYAYPNAVMLHHQMSSGLRGNLTQQKEALEEAQEWSDRLAVPVAKKMGVTYDEFVKLMYKNNSDGDWAEFADKAKKLKWVNHVVNEVRETALVTAPTSQNRGSIYYYQADTPDTQARPAAMPRGFTQEELFRSPIQFQTKLDGNGRSYIELPPLQPFDYYFMYDPDQRYRLAE
ncbi:MAG: ATP-dependent Clp protease proteolytic subunit [Phycisphaeraceae bacterium]